MNVASADSGLSPATAKITMAAQHVSPMARRGGSPIMVRLGCGGASSGMDMVCSLGLGGGRPFARHGKTDGVAVEGGARHGGGKPSPGDHRDAVGNFSELVEFFGNDEDCAAPGPQVEQGLANGDGGADIDTPCRLGDDQHAGILQDFPADDELLQVAARKASSWGIRTAPAHAELGDAALG